MRNGEIIGSSFERDIEKITFVKNVAIIMGKEIVIPKVALQDGKTVTRRYTNIWMKESGTWKLIARQSTIIATQ